MKSPTAKRVTVASLPLSEKNSQFCATALKIEDRVSGTSLREEGLLWLQLDDCPPQASVGQKCGSVKYNFLQLSHLNDPSQNPVMPGDNSDEHAPASDL
jgi:hypothetical protein